jgi:hypothetical protein
MAVSRQKPVDEPSTIIHRSGEEEEKHDIPVIIGRAPESPPNLLSNTPSSDTKHTNGKPRPSNEQDTQQVPETPEKSPFRNPFFGGRPANVTHLKVSKATADHDGQSLRKRESNRVRNNGTTLEERVEQDVGACGHSQDTNQKDRQVAPPPAPRPQHASLPEQKLSCKHSSFSFFREAFLYGDSLVFSSLLGQSGAFCLKYG